MFGSEWNGVGGLLGLFGIGGKVVDGIKGSAYDSSKKYDAKAFGQATYIDRRGVERSIRTNNKTWHVTDNEGYAVVIDSKTKEILESNREQIEKENREAKEKAIRGGDYAYKVRRPIANGSWAFRNSYEYYRTSDDKPLCNDDEIFYTTPKFHLICDCYDTTERNRKQVYKYCWEWYVEDNMQSAHPKGMLDEAKEYGIKIYEEDLQYCLDKIDEAIKNGTGFKVWDFAYECIER